MKWLILIVGGMALLALGYVADTLKQQDIRQETQHQTVVLKTLLQTKQTKIKQLEVIKKQLPALLEQWQMRSIALPEEANMPSLLEQISLLGNQCGVSIQNIRIQPERTLENYIELPVDVVLAGTYHQLSQWLSLVTTLPRIVVIGELVLSTELMHVTLKTYRSVAQVNVDEVKRYPSNQVSVFIYSALDYPDPFKTEIGSVKQVGTIERGGKRWTILANGKGLSHQVVPG